VVFITGRGDIPTTVSAMKAGAVSFLPKPVGSEELLAAIREAVTKDAAARSAYGERADIEARLHRLTPREREVLELVAAGLLNKQIAARLGTAEKTIKVHRGRLLEKMQVRSAVGLARLLGRAPDLVAAREDTRATRATSAVASDATSRAAF
jgi:RNA polymerase sigma factor (sigma-70 family)